MPCVRLAPTGLTRELVIPTMSWIEMRGIAHDPQHTCAQRLTDGHVLADRLERDRLRHSQFQMTYIREDLPLVIVLRSVPLLIHAGMTLCICAYRNSTKVYVIRYSGFFNCVDQISNERCDSRIID